MNNDVLLSVIVPVYNGEQYLERALESLRTQSVVDAQFILIDDCSTDSSLMICQKYQELDDRFIVIHNQQNKGVSYSRNKGIEIAEGEYITFLDCDDWCDPFAYETMIRNLVDNSFDMIAANGNIIFKCHPEKNRSLVLGCIPNCFGRDDAIKYLFSKDGYKGFLVNKIYVSKIIKDNNIRFEDDIYFCEDSCFLTDYLIKCNRCGFLDIECYNYWIDGNNTVEQPFSQKQYSFMKAFEHILNSVRMLPDETINYVIIDYVTSCIYMIKRAERGNNKASIRKMKSIVQKYLFRYLSNREITIKMKLYAIIVVMFPSLFRFSI